MNEWNHPAKDRIRSRQVEVGLAAYLLPAVDEVAELDKIFDLLPAFQTWTIFQVILVFDNVAGNLLRPDSEQGDVSTDLKKNSVFHRDGKRISSQCVHIPA